MRYRTFGKTGWGVSAVGLGTWNLGNQWGELDDETAARIVRSAFDTGVDLFDVAEPYGIPSGTSELCLGRALDDIRDRLRGHAPAGRLGTDYVDLMLRHEGDIEDPSTYVDVLERFYEEPSGDCAAVEVNYSPVNRSPEEDLLELRMEHDPGVLVRGPPARGLLAGKHDRDTEFTGLIRQAWNEGGDRREEFLEKLSTLERIQEALGPDEQLVPTALRYAMSHPVDPVVIPGATSPARAVENATVEDRPLEADRRRELAEI